MTTVIDKKIINVSVNEPTPDLPPPERKKRPAILNGQTAKIQVGGSPTDQFNCYLTLNCLDTNVPFEVFIDSSHTDNVHYVKAISRLASAMLRSDDPKLNLEFIGNELAKIHANDGYFAKVAGKKKGSYQNGVVQHIGRTLISLHNKVTSSEPEEELHIKPEWITGLECPKCKRPTLTKIGGCTKCMDTEGCQYEGECG
ncbi:MAG: hypothetical protein HOE77_10145 [Candidatus Marinimicrobia bacterium]|jgi:hypothetical protein|nr:hypothetical protein [Candidatus Neomarinimicrobiota bacterium]